MLTVIFRKPKDSIPRTVSVFWKDPQHLAFHFSFLTGAEPLNKAIMQRYKDQFKNIEVFVKNYGSSKTKENLAKIEEDCQIEHNGASTWKEINLLVIKKLFQLCNNDYCMFQRFFTEYFDKSLCSLIRMESDGEPDESGSPHIFVVQAER